MEDEMKKIKNYKCTAAKYKPEKGLKYPPVIRGNKEAVTEYCKWLFGKDANFAMSETNEPEDILL